MASAHHATPNAPHVSQFGTTVRLAKPATSLLRTTVPRVLPGALNAHPLMPTVLNAH